MQIDQTHLGWELVLCFAVGGVQENSIRPHKALQVLIAHEVLPKAHVAAMYVLATIRQPEEKLHSSCRIAAFSSTVWVSREVLQLNRACLLHDAALLVYKSCLIR